MRYGPPNSFEDASILALIYPPSSTSYYNYSSPISSPIISYENHHSNRSEPTEFDNLFYQEELDLSRDEWNTNEYPSSNQQEIPVDQDSRAEIEALYLSTDSEESPASDRMPRTQEQAQTYVQSVAKYNELAPFIVRLSLLLQHPEWYQDVLCWNEAGTHFAIKTESTRLRDFILPLYYSHNQIASFQRQLNAYGFTRLPKYYLDTHFEINPYPASTYAVYFHKDFNRIHWKQATSLKPKVSKARQLEAKLRLEGISRPNRRGSGSRKGRILKEFEERSGSGSD